MAVPQLKLDPAMVERLACPACFGGLRPGDTQLVCMSCGRAYPIVDGIPVLIAERAEMSGNQTELS
jgi:uncharacterized protein YbaR (Trm112 family)